MHNIKRREWSAVTLDELIRYVDDRAYNIWIPAADVTTSTAATLGSVNSYPLWILPDGATNGVIRSVARPATWLSGTIKTTLYYSGSVLGNAFRINGAIRIFRSGDLLGTPTYNTSFFSTIAGPTAADVITKIDLAQGAPVVQADEIINVFLNRIGADAADTNVGDMYFLGMLLTYTEGKREIGLKTQ